MTAKRLLLAALLAALPAQAGTELTIETRRAGAAEGSAPQRSVVEVEGRRLHAEAGDGRHGALWSGEEGVLQILDHADKSVLRIDRSMAQSVAGARDGILERTRGLPESQRKALEGLLGGGAGPAVALVNTGQSAELNGISCRLLDAQRDGARLAEICEGPRGAAGVSPETLATLHELAAFLAEVGDLLPRSLGAEGLDTLVLAAQVKGVPLRVRVWPKGAPATESRLVRAVSKHYDASHFQPPAGYQAGLGVHQRE